MIEELEVGGGDLSVPPTLSSEREANFDYPTCSWTNSNGDTMEVIYVGVLEERHLVLMPGVAWHRKPAQRKFTEILSKPTSVQLPCAAVNNREEMLENTMKGWLGFVTDEVAAELEPVEGVVLLRSRRGYWIPAPCRCAGGSGYEALRLCFCRECGGWRRGWCSTSSGPKRRCWFGSHWSGCGFGSGAAGKSWQFGEDHVGYGGKPATCFESSESSCRASDCGKEGHYRSEAEEGFGIRSGFEFWVWCSSKVEQQTFSTEDPVSTSFPSLDPGVVAAATAAGIPQETLQEMEKLMGVDLAGAKRLKEASMTKSRAAPPRKGVAGVLSESEDEETEAEGSGVDSGGNPLEASLQKLTEIVGILAMDKKKKAKTSKMEQALDGISAGSGSDASIAGGVKRAAAARRVLRQALVDHPAEVSGMLERLLMEDLTSQVQGPGMPEAAF